MKIESITNNVLIVGTDHKGKGGIAILLKSYSLLFPQFNYVCSHRFTNKFNQIWISFSAFIKVLYYCTFQSIKIVHIHTASYNAFIRDSIYLLLAKLFRKKVILHLHGGKFEEFYNLYPTYCHFICNKADCIVGVSMYLCNILNKMKINNNIKVIYNAIDKPLFKKNTLERKILNITFLGAIVENKGIFDILECIENNKSYFKDKVIFHIGGVGEETKLQSIINKFNLHNIVKYHGWMNRKEKELLLSETDIYLQPSYFESLGIAIIEAMGYGIPIIASNTGGIPELVQNEKNGFLLQPGSIDDMFIALKKLIENDILRKEFGINSLNKSRMFTYHCMKQSLLGLYNSISKS